MIMAIVMCMGFASCSKGGNTSESEEKGKTDIITPYEFKERTIKTDGQTYTGGLITYPDVLWQTPKFDYEPTLDFGTANNVDVSSVKGLFITSPIKYNGKETKIAAYLGFPENIKDGEKVPAIVLVHGGLGTAIPDWVKYWNDLGFAAISIDTEGAEPIKGVSNYNNIHLPENRYKDDEIYINGPTNNSFGDYQKDIQEQWMYHATSATILACSLISSFDCVDAQKIGITGISWGGMITNIVVGYDDRFSFAMPIYGALSLTESNSGFSTIYVNNERNDISARRWDTLEPLKQTNCKVFEVNGIQDPAFSFDASSRCAEASNGFALFKKKFTHGQEFGAYEENLPLFAKYFCGMESEYVEVMHNPTFEDPKLSLRPYGDVTIDEIKIYYTTDAKPTKTATWRARKVPVLNNVYDYMLNIPTESTYFYVSICYNNNLEVSTYLQKNE